MILLSSNLLEASSITHIEEDNFLEKKVVSIVLIRGSSILNLFIQNENGKMECVIM